VLFWGVLGALVLAFAVSCRAVLAPLGARVGAQRLGLLLRFGLPTVPAEASESALSIVDRYYIYHHYIQHNRGPALAGLYSIAVKLAGAVAFIVRAFQYAWPPLAYSVSDDAEAKRLYGLVATYYALISGWAVAGLSLEARWILRLLAAPRFFEAYQAVPWLSLGWAMYGLWVVLLVIAGRARVTRRNLPAALAGLGVTGVELGDLERDVHGTQRCLVPAEGAMEGGGSGRVARDAIVDLGGPQRPVSVQQGGNEVEQPLEAVDLGLGGRRDDGGHG